MDTFLDVPAIIQRTKQHLGFRTDSQLAHYLGISRPTLSNWIARNSIDLPLLLQKCEELDFNWLLLGEGKPEKSSRCIATGEVEGRLELVHRPKSSERLDTRSIPIYDIVAAANLRTLFERPAHFVMGNITIPNMPQCDGAIYVAGDSMYPLLKSGDMVGFKELHQIDHLIYGEMYVVSFSLDGDDFLSVKFVNRSDKPQHIKLVSYNTYHEPMDIPISSIQAMALVKFSIRRHTLG